MSEQHEAVIRQRLRDYLVGVLSEEDRVAVEAEIAANPEYQSWVEADRALLARIGELPHAPASDDLVRRTLDSVRQPEYIPAASPRRVWLPALAVTCVVLIAGAIILPALGRARESARRASSQNNLKQWGLIFKMYSNASKGERFPPVVRQDGLWVPDLRSVYPEFLTDPAIAFDPKHADDYDLFREALDKNPPDWDTAHRLLARNYNYLGLAVRTDEEFAKLTSDRALVAEALPDSDLTIDGETFYALREGIERFLLTDINNPTACAKMQSDIPIMFESPARARSEGRRGINVLYLDGHVDLLRFPSDFPATDSVADAIPLPEPPR